MKTVSLRLEAEGDEADWGLARANLDDDDIALLRAYLVSMERIHATRLLRRGLPSITKISMGVEGFIMESEPYEDSEVHELLHVLRHVTLARERASFEAVADLLDARFSSPQVSKHVAALKGLFEHGELRAYMQIQIGSRPLFDSSVLRMWLNGTQYHTDAAKAAAWSDLERSLTVPNARALVMNQLRGRVIALLMLEQMVRLCISDPPRLDPHADTGGQLD